MSPTRDLIDEIWPSDERPQKPDSQIRVHDLKFAGILIKFLLLIISLVKKFPIEKTKRKNVEREGRIGPRKNEECGRYICNKISFKQVYFLYLDQHI